MSSKCFENESQCQCPICFIDLIPGSFNYCITECGHSFCLSCISKHVSTNKNCCPYCRTILFEKNNNDKEHSQEPATRKEQ